MNSISTFRNLISKKITSNTFERIFHLFDRTRIIYLFRETFRIFIKIFSESIIFSNFDDSINIRVKKSINFSTESSILTISYRYMNHFLFLKVFKNCICLIIKSTWIFVICDEVDNIRNSNFKSVFQIFHIFVHYFDKKSVLKLFVFFEIIAKSYSFI